VRRRSAHHRSNSWQQRGRHHHREQRPPAPPAARQHQGARGRHHRAALCSALTPRAHACSAPSCAGGLLAALCGLWCAHEPTAEHLTPQCKQASADPRGYDRVSRAPRNTRRSTGSKASGLPLPVPVPAAALPSHSIALESRETSSAKHNVHFTYSAVADDGTACQLRAHAVYRRLRLSAGGGEELSVLAKGSGHCAPTNKDVAAAEQLCTALLHAFGVLVCIYYGRCSGY
jgi:hypothetical protein